MKSFKEFIKHIEDNGYGYEEKRGKILAFERIEAWENAISKNIDMWDKELLIQLCIEGVTLDLKSYIVSTSSDRKLISLSQSICHSGYYGLMNKIGYMNDVFDYLNRDDLKLKITDLQHHIKSKTDELFTKAEIIDICDSLTNVQDKFIIYSLFSCIRGNKYSDLVNIKTKDVDLKNKTITLQSGKTIIMDDYLEDIVKDITSDFGNIYYRLNKSGRYSMTDFYEFNPDSEFLLKVKPTKSNNNGLGAMSFQGLQTRLQSLSNITGMPIKGLNIYRSGVIHKMHEISSDWKQYDIDAFIKENQFGLNAYETQRAFEDKYANTQEEVSYM